MTYTVSTLEVSPRTHAEIAGLLRAAGYDHAICDGLIDMTHIGLTCKEPEAESAQESDQHYAELAEAFLNKMDAFGPITPPESIALRAVIARLRRYSELLNNPQTSNFLESVRCEVAHQIERWGTVHDRAKEPSDWFWLVGYLAGKALQAATGKAMPRYRHVKRGTTYEVIFSGEDENNRSSNLVVYRGEDDGKVWIRPSVQFFDGRFEELPAKPQEKALHHTISTAAVLANWHAAISMTDNRMQPGSSDMQRFLEQTFGDALDLGDRS